jgi:HSP20 family protein
MAADATQTTQTAQSAQSGTPPQASSPSTTGASTERESKIPVQKEMSSDMGAESSGMEMTQPTSVSPFALMRAMMDDMNSMFGGTSGLGFGNLASSLFGTRRRGSLRARSQDALWLPAIDVSKRGDQLVVHAELPGLNAKDVNVEVDNGTLTITGERQQSTGDAYHSERSYGSFYRAIPLPENVDTNAIKATFQNGVLEVTMPSPKPEQETRRKIEVT